ncbi:MAG: SIR2 family protein [Methanobacterium sp.]
MYSIDALLRDISYHQTALFIGAGAARCHLTPEHQLPNGDEMKRKILEYRYGSEPSNIDPKDSFKKEFKISSENLLPEVVWEKCLSGSGYDLPWFSKLIQDMFNKNKYIPPNYKFIAWLNLMDKRVINEVVTTNFDEKIEDAYTFLQKRGLFSDLTVLTAAYDEDYKHITPSKETRSIYKLHGTISQPYSIISSVSEMEKDLHPDKYKLLKEIFSSNSLVIFLGYACNDQNIFDALKKISNEVKTTKVVWVKRSEVSEKDNIYKILKLFNKSDPKDNIVLSESYEFLLKVFNHNVNREEIDLSFIRGQTKTIVDKLSTNSEIFLKYENNYQIHDALYGKVKFPSEFGADIFKVVNSLDLQRLRDIKQLSSAHYKYPSATHTRFSHSLGVAYLVSKALENPYMKTCTDNDKRNTIYAALLHDIGHGPLGHVLDKFFDRIKKANEHEHFTREFISSGLFDLAQVLENVDVNKSEIKSKIIFNSKNKSMPKAEAEKAYLSWLITDHALDLDRVDFLMRDLTFTQEIPNINIPQLIQMKSSNTVNSHINKKLLLDIVSDYINRLNVATYEELSEELQKLYPRDIKLLYIDQHGKYELHQLIDFLLDLYCHMYLEVYYNDEVSCSEAMMAKALHIAYEIGDIDRSRLYKFTDSELFTYLEELENDIIRDIVYSVKYNRLLKPIAEFSLEVPENVTAVEIEDKIEKDFGLDRYSFESMVVAHIPRKKKFSNLLIKERDKIISYPALETFDKKLSQIKGNLFVNPALELYSSTQQQEKLLRLLEKLGLNEAKIISKEKIKINMPQQTFAHFEILVDGYKEV